jgi:predicted HD phosphohydrolase
VWCVIVDANSTGDRWKERFKHGAICIDSQMAAVSINNHVLDHATTARAAGTALDYAANAITAAAVAHTVNDLSARD